MKTQNVLGSYGYKLNSSACEDIDSIDPLTRFSPLSDYRASEIKNSLQLALSAILHNFNPDGGWVFRRNEAFLYGHPEMFSKENQSSMFATWFRTLGMAYCLEGLKPFDATNDQYRLNWHFLNCPGYQFL